jgi:inosine/xanthosine triphosphatase
MASSTIKTVVVASKNIPKLSATREGFTRLLSGSTFDVEGVSVSSGVSDQPLSDEETLQGANNRAKNARVAQPNADFWVGIEGGVEEHQDAIQSFAWVVVIDREGRAGRARTSAYYLPEETTRLLREGKELGEAEDVVWGQTNSKNGMGSIGLLTGGVVDRAEYYTQAVVLALIPFKNEQLTFK